jgi:Leucine-rich repeat (LRR) protein
MSLPFIVEHGIYGPRITVTGPWTPAIAEYMRREGVRELYLNHARGWSGTTLDFLETVPELVAFSILDFTIKDITPIHRLAALRALEVSTYCNTKIDFHRFAKLERCVLYWRSGSESLFECVALRWLFLHRYGGSSSEPFARLAMLDELSIANSELREVEHLAALKGLKFLGLYNLKKLTSLRGIEALEQLEALEVNGCKSIGRIDELAALAHLRRLQLNDDGPIKSLKPLRSATALEEILFYESTNIVDGDLTPLAALPRLQHISFQNRRHYSHKRETFPLAGHSSSVIAKHG